MIPISQSAVNPRARGFAASFGTGRSDYGTVKATAGVGFLNLPARVWARIQLLFFALVVTKYALVPPLKRAVALSANAAAAQDNGRLFYTRIQLAANTSAGHNGFRSLAVIGADNSIKNKIDQNQAKLTSLAVSELRDTTVSDLDKPGALDAKRAQLREDFNRALGGPVVQDVYIAEYPQ